ncbi:MAG: hypothetical protein DRG50_03440 [Deltaproteobacteria bacterium]|nr:MAG: hypothetical protein DRG50_03440 [Deltaproteobacteria bacterium]
MWSRERSKLGKLGQWGIIFLVFTLISFSLWGCTTERVSGSIGTPAADFLLKDLRGEEIALSQFRGKAVIIDFWATWCPPCRASIPHLRDIYRRYKGRGLVVLGIILEQSSASSIFLYRRYGHQLSCPVGK